MSDPDRTPRAAAASMVLLEPRASVRLELLGGCTVTSESGRAHALTGKPAALVALAALEPTTSRRRAALLLWPDSPEPLARNNLRTLMHRLSKQLGIHLFASAERIALDSAVAQMQVLPAEGIVAALRAGGPRRCELLGDVGLDELEDFHGWLESARQRLRQAQLRALEERLAKALSQADSAAAIDCARACVALEPLSELWHRQLMHTLAACGDRAAALAAYEECEATLRDNLGATPDERTRSLHVHILQGLVGGDAAAPATSASLPAAARADALALVEREVPLATLQGALSRGLHVVLQGEAGVGKTRLLRHVTEGRAMERITVRAGALHEPYAALAQVLQEVQQRRALRPDRSERIELARIAPAAFPDVPPSSAGVSGAQLRAALLHWAALLHESGVQWLALDDLHYADLSSQSALACLLSPHPDAPHSPPALQLLLSHRSGDIGTVLSQATVDAQVHKRLEVVTLERLTRPGIETLLRTIGRNAQAAEQESHDLLQTTGGNPLFVIELTLFRKAEPVGNRLGPVGTNLEALLQSRLACCSEPARQLAYTAGVALADFSVELAASVTAKSPLALMPAWTELQERGLFGDSGLAHDLVRDAVLTSLPEAIRKALHRQVALFLEQIGRSGATVLRHWLAVGDCERAFPHAMQVLQQRRRIGLDELRDHEMLFNVIEGLQGRILLDHLWSTAMLMFWGLSDSARQRFTALIERVAALADSDTTRAWVAFERSRQLQYSQRDARSAHALLLRATAAIDLPVGVRFWVERFLTRYANEIGAQPHVHAQRMAEAAAQFPRSPENVLLHRESLMTRSAFLLEHAACAREGVSALRAARHAGDVGAQREARLCLAYTCMGAGVAAAATRHFNFVIDSIGAGELAAWQRKQGSMLGHSVLQCGRFSEALAHLEVVLASGTAHAPHARPYIALAWLMLGRSDLAREHAAAVQADQFTAFEVVVDNALMQSRLALLHGGDAAEPLRSGLDQLHSAGASPECVGRLQSALAACSASPAERVDVAARAVAALRPPTPSPGLLTDALLLLAEAHADAGSVSFRGFALEGAALARRGRCGGVDYLPDLLSRYARLLQHTDPALAASLLHVARRWVRQALRHLPAAAQHAFVNGNPVNRALLAT